MSEKQFLNETESGCQEGNSQVYVLSDEEIHHLLNNVKVNQGSAIFNQNRRWPINGNQQEGKPDSLFEEMASRLGTALPEGDVGRMNDDQDDGDMMVFPDVISMENYIKELSSGSGHFSRSKLWERTIVGGEGKTEKLLTDILEELRMFRNDMRK